MATTLALLFLCYIFRHIHSETIPEWFYNISTDIFDVPGDIMLGGLFSINYLTSNLTQRTEPGNISCDNVNNYGLGLALVMKYTVDEINTQQILLPGHKLGYKIYDTCRESAIIVKPTLSFLTERSTNVLSVECNYTDYETSISAVIGPHSSEMVAVIGKLLGFFLMPQISYGATSDKFSDKLLYPSFFRTVSSDKWQVAAIMLLLNKFNWNWVAIVGSDEEYGQGGVQEFSKMAENNSVCVAYQGMIPAYTAPEATVKTILNNIEVNGVTVVVLFAVPEYTHIFFEEVVRRNMTGVWIATTSWSNHYLLTDIPNIKSVGTIIGFIDDTEPLDLLEPYIRILFTKLSKEREGISPQKPPKYGNPDNPCPQCWNLSPVNISLVQDAQVQSGAFAVYGAIYSVAQALRTLLGCNETACMKRSDTKIYPWKLLQILKNSSVEVKGRHLVFDSEGNPNIGFVVIQWTWNDSVLEFKRVGSFYKTLSINETLFTWHTENSEVPESTCSAACEDGQIRRVKGYHSCCFDCIDCQPGTYQANVDDIQCTPCPKGQWSLIRSTNCTEPTFDILYWDSKEALAMMLAGALHLVCVGSVGVVFLKHRGTVMVKASGGIQIFVALLSLMGACLSLLLFLGQPNDVVCSLQLPLISIFQTAPLSIIMFISLQIVYVSEFPKMAVSHLHFLRGPGCWMFLLGCCAVQAGICGWFSWTGTSLSEYRANLTINFVRDFLACPVDPLAGFALIQCFNCAMCLVSFMCTFMAAKPPHQYNLARDITFSSLIYCVFWVTFIPIYIGLNVKNKSIVHVSFTLASNFGLMAAYFFPKCHFLLRKPELNTDDNFCTFLEGVSPTPAEEGPQPKPEPEK